MIRRSVIAILIAAATPIFGHGAASASEGELVLFANGEDLALDGFLAPKLTRDDWELRFDHIYVTFANIFAHQADPPYDARTGGALVAKLTVSLTDGPVTVDLTETDKDGRVRIGSARVPEGHYNAVSWLVAPAPSGEFEGYSMIFIGRASRDGREVRFTLLSADTHVYTCGEFVGSERKGVVKSGSSADLELTFHLDHIFGRADRDAGGAVNTGAVGFDAFSKGGTQMIHLKGLHIGHVGEGHCAVEYR